MSAIRHLGVNAMFLQPRMGGIETYVRRLVPALAELRPDWRISVFVNERGRELLAAEPWADAVTLVRWPLLGARGTRALTELALLGALADRRGVDLLHSVALTAPLRVRALNVVTLADVTWLHQPEPAERHTVRLWRAIVPPVARRADRLIAISEASRREIVDALGIPRERIDVTPLGHGVSAAAAPTVEQELRERLRLGSGPLVLSVSAMKVHKNLPRLVEAMARVREAVPGAVLVIPGNPTPRQRELAELAERLGIGEAVRFPGWVSERDLEGLYRHAACFAFPSLREGFGLPLLEAMARDLPVACSRASALPEVAGDAALYFDPESVEDIAATVTRLLADRALAARLAAAGSERQALFTWRRTAEETVASYERAGAA